ncbi:hypothetical protein MTO96_016245 [Rhipicephalus appendiculatus]
MVGTDSGDGPDVCTARLTCLRELSAGELAGVRHRGRVAPYGKGRTSRDASSRRGGGRARRAPKHAIAHACPQWAVNEVGATKEATGERKAAGPARCVSVPRPTPAREREGGLVCRALARLPRARFGRRHQTTGVEEEASPPLSPSLPSRASERGGDLATPAAKKAVRVLAVRGRPTGFLLRVSHESSHRSFPDPHHHFRRLLNGSTRTCLGSIANSVRQLGDALGASIRVS